MFANIFKNGFKYDKILILRAFACLIVFLSHLPLPEPNFILSTDGAAAVRIFFILSGYLMGKNYLNGRYKFDLKNTLRFYKNRVVRIAPLYYFVVACLFIFVYPSVWQWQNWYKILGTLTFSFDFDALPYFTGSLWSLSVEMQFYLLAPFLIFLIFKYTKNLKDSLIVLGFSVIFSLVSYFLIYRNIVTVPNQIRHFLVHFFCFPVGISLNHLFLFFDQKYAKIRDFIYKYSNWLFGLSLVMIYLILSSRTYYFHFINPKFATTLSFITVYTFIIVFFSTIILYLAESNCIQTREISPKRMFAKPIAFFEILGILSYGFYLWHGDILNFYRKSIGITNYSQYIAVMLLSFITTLFVSYGTYIIIEKRKF